MQILRACPIEVDHFIPALRSLRRLRVSRSSSVQVSSAEHVCAPTLHDARAPRSPRRRRALQGPLELVGGCPDVSPQSPSTRTMRCSTACGELVGGALGLQTARRSKQRRGVEGQRNRNGEKGGAERSTGQSRSRTRSLSQRQHSKPPSEQPRHSRAAPAAPPAPALL